MPYQIIDAVMARAIQEDTARPPAVRLDRYARCAEISRRVRGAPRRRCTGSYALLGHLAELQAQLPPGLECVVRPPNDLPEVVEVWFPA
jgi:hypothetical protein